MNLFEDIRKSIQEDIENGLNVELLSDSEGVLCVYDDVDLFSREYSITDPAKIDTAWIREKILVTPSAERLPYQIDPDVIAAWASESIDPAMLMTLKNIVFVNEDEEDFDYLRSLSEDFYHELECSDLPSAIN